MITLLKIAAATLLSLSGTAAHAYGSSQSSQHCDKPVFSEFQPATNKYLQSFSEFSLMASANTTLTSVVVNVSAGETKYHFTPKQLQITQQPSGRLEIKGKVDRPIESGFARLSVTAHSKPGCEKTDGYLIRIH
ncbi:hypothetical protein [Methylomonas sp. ZR1]|uniref:hypothetical protein n=1 Tax=unclassified Methylomonas TaxID=2608980 RepID=UPI001491E83C|nr:hypothetical protein [Methylomonas sp. ZR1]NOV30413.1 hypothetical protein [Methylomonas sp. ZR1]